MGLIPHLVILLSAVIQTIVANLMLQFYIKLFGKNVNAADSAKQIVLQKIQSSRLHFVFYLLWLCF
jgi:hypothetical protein